MFLNRQEGDAHQAEFGARAGDEADAAFAYAASVSMSHCSNVPLQGPPE